MNALAVVLIVVALLNLRITYRHLDNLIGNNKRVNESLAAVEQGLPPTYPIALVEHLKRVERKGPAATTEKLRWDWVGFVAVGLVVSAALGIVGALILLS